MQKILLSNLSLKGLMKKINLIEVREMNLDEAIEDNKKQKKKIFFKRIKNKFNKSDSLKNDI